MTSIGNRIYELGLRTKGDAVETVVYCGQTTKHEENLSSQLKSDKYFKVEFEILSKLNVEVCIRFISISAGCVCKHKPFHSYDYAWRIHKPRRHPAIRSLKVEENAENSFFDYKEYEERPLNKRRKFLESRIRKR